MGEPAHVVVAAEEGGEELEQDPEADGEIGRQAQGDALQEQAPDLHPRIEQEIGGDHARDRAGGADEGPRRIRVHPGVRQPGGDAAQDEEDDEAQVPHRVLDVVAEHPQEEHVAAEVQQGPVQEDAGDERQMGGNGDADGWLVAEQHRGRQAEPAEEPLLVHVGEPEHGEEVGRHADRDEAAGRHRRLEVLQGHAVVDRKEHRASPGGPAGRAYRF
jgi:hypothetical protein